MCVYVFEVCTGSLGYESLGARWIPRACEHGPNHGPRAVQNAGHCVKKWGRREGCLLAQWQGSQWFGVWEGDGQGLCDTTII